MSKFKVGDVLVRAYQYAKDEEGKPLFRTAELTVHVVQGEFYACTWISEDGWLCSAVFTDKGLVLKEQA